jgi:hypothetical protein
VQPWLHSFFRGKTLIPQTTRAVSRANYRMTVDDYFAMSAIPAFEVLATVIMPIYFLEPRHAFITIS